MHQTIPISQDNFTSIVINVFSVFFKIYGKFFWPYYVLNLRSWSLKLDIIELYWYLHLFHSTNHNKILSLEINETISFRMKSITALTEVARTYFKIVCCKELYTLRHYAIILSKIYFVWKILALKDFFFFYNILDAM